MTLEQLRARVSVRIMEHEPRSVWEPRLADEVKLSHVRFIVDAVLRELGLVIMTDGTIAGDV